MRGLRALAIVAACTGFAGPVGADPEPVHVPYRAVFAGIEVGTGALTVEVNRDHYKLSLDAVVVESGERKGARAKAHVTGNMLPGNMMRNPLAPEQYSAALERGGEKTRVALGFANGVLSMVAVLPPGPDGSGRTRPSPQQSRGVIDPLSALAIPASPANLAPLSACGRTQRIFDGTRRYDIVLFPSRVEAIEVAGQTITSLVCRTELRSAAATQPRRPEQWPELQPRGQRGLVWLAAVAGGRLLVPVRVEAGLRFGTLTIEATDGNAFAAAVRSASLR